MSSLPVVLLGAGGHARVVRDVIGLRGLTPVGVSAPELAKGIAWHGLVAVGDDDAVLQMGGQQVLLANGIGVIPGQAVRVRVHQRFQAQGFRFVTLVHPSAVLAACVELGEGVQVMAGAVIQPGSRIADGVVVNTGALVDHECHIEQHAFIGPGATLCGQVRVEARAFIGAGAVVLPGVTVKRNTVVGAGAVVVCTVEAGTTVVGNPARCVS
ncbi:NeuD/PglB/VioB family sugar acetyltransferase [Pseudomonas xanthosomatis]|uniref:NeuD/PglB/VioB family sugar acetyltransferase n=1 Tax=Pseudomonas xanthosomatis TaxID=2842356 RepID=UPI001C3D0D27|nr:NeuD/PglB/VioB family sugar acetyltransferase [Pseudomonas xanthosomatis]QXH48304.1 NeuD/PglB/VioB family sugar acetyltransferase [Pseudomonas xanthosomatis]